MISATTYFDAFSSSTPSGASLCQVLIDYEQIVYKGDKIHVIGKCFEQPGFLLALHQDTSIKIPSSILSLHSVSTFDDIKETKIIIESSTPVLYDYPEILLTEGGSLFCPHPEEASYYKLLPCTFEDRQISFYSPFVHTRDEMIKSSKKAFEDAWITRHVLVSYDTEWSWVARITESKFITEDPKIEEGWIPSTAISKSTNGQTLLNRQSARNLPKRPPFGMCLVKACCDYGGQYVVENSDDGKRVTSSPLQRDRLYWLPLQQVDTGLSEWVRVLDQLHPFNSYIPWGYFFLKEASFEDFLKKTTPLGFPHTPPKHLKANHPVKVQEVLFFEWDPFRQEATALSEDGNLIKNISSSQLAKFSFSDDKFLGKIQQLSSSSDMTLLIKRLIEDDKEQVFKPKVHAEIASKLIVRGDYLGHGSFGFVHKVSILKERSQPTSFDSKAIVCKLLKLESKDGQNLNNATRELTMHTQVAKLAPDAAPKLFFRPLLHTGIPNGLPCDPIKTSKYSKFFDNLVFDTKQTLFMEMFMELSTVGALSQLLWKPHVFNDEKVLATLAYHLLKTVKALHEDARVMHLDIKPENVLIIADEEELGDGKNHKDVKTGLKSPGSHLVFCDYSAALPTMRDEKGDKEELVPWFGNMTTLPFAAPELVDQSMTHFSSKVDIWSIGCVLLELGTTVEKRLYSELFSDLARLATEISISSVIGPERKSIKQRVKEGLLNPDFNGFHDLLEQCLSYDPDSRPSAAQLLEHWWIKQHADNELDLKNLFPKTTEREEKVSVEQGNDDTTELTMVRQMTESTSPVLTEESQTDTRPRSARSKLKRKISMKSKRRLFKKQTISKD